FSYPPGSGPIVTWLRRNALRMQTSKIVHLFLIQETRQPNRVSKSRPATKQRDGYQDRTWTPNSAARMPHPTRAPVAIIPVAHRFESKGEPLPANRTLRNPQATWVNRISGPRK